MFKETFIKTCVASCGSLLGFIVGITVIVLLTGCSKRTPELKKYSIIDLVSRKEVSVTWCSCGKGGCVVELTGGDILEIPVGAAKTACRIKTVEIERVK